MPAGSHCGVVYQDVQPTQLPGDLRNSRIDGTGGCLVQRNGYRSSAKRLYSVADRFGALRPMKKSDCDVDAFSRQGGTDTLSKTAASAGHQRNRTR